MSGPLDPDRRPEIRMRHVYRCRSCNEEIAFILRIPAWLEEEHLSLTGPDCGGRLDFLREEPR